MAACAVAGFALPGRRSRRFKPWLLIGGNMECQHMLSSIMTLFSREHTSGQTALAGLLACVCNWESSRSSHPRERWDSRRPSRATMVAGKPRSGHDSSTTVSPLFVVTRIDSSTQQGNVPGLDGMRLPIVDHSRRIGASIFKNPWREWSSTSVERTTSGPSRCSGNRFLSTPPGQIASSVERWI